MENEKEALDKEQKTEDTSLTDILKKVKKDLKEGEPVQKITKRYLPGDI